MTEYRKFLKDWTSERGITSFLGSEKPEFQQDWKEEKKGGVRFGERIKAGAEREAMSGEDINRAGEPFKKPKPKRTAAETVFTNPDLLKQIGAFTNPKRQLKINDFFIKDSDGDESISKQVFNDFLLERGMDSGMYKGDVYLKDLNQYTELLDILAQSIYGMKQFRDTGYGETDRYGNYAKGNYAKYNEKIRFPVFKKVLADLLKKELPTDISKTFFPFNYDDFWSKVSYIRSPVMTRINNVQMKKLFSNWKNKGKRFKVGRQADPDPYQGN